MLRCPHCNSLLSLREMLRFSLHGKKHAYECHHCHRILHGKKEPIGFYPSMCFGYLAVILSFWGWIKYVEDNFWEAILVALAAGFLWVVIVAIVTIFKSELE